MKTVTNPTTLKPAFAAVPRKCGNCYHWNADRRICGKSRTPGPSFTCWTVPQWAVQD